MEGNFVFLFLDWNRFSQYPLWTIILLLANKNAHLTTHEPIKIPVILIKKSQNQVEICGERRADDGDFSFESS